MGQKAVVVFTNVPEGTTGQAVLLSLARILNEVQAETSEVINPTTVFVQLELKPGSAIVLRGSRGDETVLISSTKPRAKVKGAKVIAGG